MSTGVWLCQLPDGIKKSDILVDSGKALWRNSGQFEYALLPTVPLSSDFGWEWNIINESQMRRRYWQFAVGVFLDSDSRLKNKGSNFIELILKKP